jgi:hypothetical protein
MRHHAVLIGFAQEGNHRIKAEGNTSLIARITE